MATVAAYAAPAAKAHGGIAETQEMLDFCAAHWVSAEIERIRADEINTALPAQFLVKLA
ncbi:hypothetical protein GCM10023196_015660 [Actinoallomurus vinaceus]|uniref:Uncharacterized protein n=1 Tax=Actinoallomurus vinaceus TaxID=1080074 RepID=A0ABP8U321_9ACTN